MNVSVCIVLSILVVMFIVFLVNSSNFTYPYDILMYRSIQNEALTQIHGLAAQALSQDSYFINEAKNGTSLQDQLTNIIQKYRFAKSEASDLSSLKDYEINIPSVMNIRKNFDCSDILGAAHPIGKCTGLDELDGLFISYVQQFISSLSSSSTPNDENFLKLHMIEKDFLSPLHDTACGDFYDATVKSFDNQLLVYYALFAVGVVLSFFSYLLARRPFTKLSQEQRTFYEMLLLLPLEYIEENPDIKMLLTTGKISQVNAEESLDLQIEATQTKTERILQASADAVIIFDATTLKVEVFNSSAEKMFGYTSDHMIGREITTIIPDDVIVAQLNHLEIKLLKEQEDDSSKNVNVEPNGIAMKDMKKKGKKKQRKNKITPDDSYDDNGSYSEENAWQSMDVTATHSDGTKIPVTLSMSSSGTTCALFIRDMRDIKGYQNLIEMNETLLQKILPKSIALRLKDIIMRDEPVAIADNHEKTSILFADMVKFTNWSSNMEPATLVRILNGIVSTWDTLAMKFGVEKIKTIGDCYMAVCGCPEPNPVHADAIVGFADAMILALRDFNIKNKTDIHIRVGVHSGPVLAGVIGLNKILYDIWGRAVSTAARMESSGEKDCVHISADTYALLTNKHIFKSRGRITLKNGAEMETFLYKSGTVTTQTNTNIARHGTKFE